MVGLVGKHICSMLLLNFWAEWLSYVNPICRSGWENQGKDGGCGIV